MAKRYPCAVLGCKSADWENETTRHRLPHDEALRNAWLVRIGVSAESKRNGDLRVCGRHFRAEDYHHNPRLLQEWGCGLTPRLRPNALPTLFLPRRPTSQTKPTPAAALGASTIEALQHSQPAVPCECRYSQAESTVGTQTEVAADHSPRVLHSVGTQTVPEQCTISVQTSRHLQKSVAMQADFAARLLVSKGTQNASSVDVILARTPEHADVPASPAPTDFFENARCSTPIPYMEEVECEIREAAGDETYKPTLESFEDTFASGCMEPVELASANSEGPTAEASVLPPLAFDSHIEPRTATAHTSENQDLVTTFREERKFVVFESCLRQLLPVACSFCHKKYTSTFSVVGSMVTVRSSCDNCRHVTSWKSQPLIGDKPAGNVLMAAALLFSGCTVSQTLRLLQSINVQAISETTFFKYQAFYMVPAVEKLYKEQQAQLLSRVAGVDVDLAGGGRCDSPGHSAKYGTYVLYCTQVKRILDCQQIQVHESAAVSSSNAMEKEGLARSLQKLDKQGVGINSITTDRHPAIRSYCQKERPGMKHYFDVWHIAKGINKKLSIASKHRNCGSILLWSRSIINHLYFVAAASHGDGDLIVSMWRSVLNHICNQHNGHEGPFTDCVHGPLRNKKWMTRGLSSLCYISTRMLQGIELRTELGRRAGRRGSASPGRGTLQPAKSRRHQHLDMSPN
ncbi:uncharacterized protein LOC119450703 isoform X2 [Dermacentor silvarum]|uniref:uncharacterized protein LOC119450703 isoform X2 n=1 Tax=Dermacentor silvarum TaxID=543639 RepID=UPI0021019EED|nr:uncharacterized protein LOC119450703 isoform X2 [Dermacentor silvarum]